MQDKNLRIHQFEPASRANGPGVRAVVWVQGCALACPGCFNPATHDLRGGELLPVEALTERILAKKAPIEGLTISGGEPLHQYRALTRLFEQIHAQTNLSILVFSGYDWQEIRALTHIEAFLAHVDVLIAGRYQAQQRIADGLIGSSNKTIHYLTDRYTPQDLQSVPTAEIFLSPDGQIRLSGIDPIQW